MRKRSSQVNFAIEFVFLFWSFFAWGWLGRDDINSECATFTTNVLLLVYMRCLQMISILTFLICCGPIICYMYIKNRPRPSVDPK